MADVAADPWRLTAPAQAVADSLGASYLSVEESRWATWQPNLPAEIAAFLAEPVLVGASPAGFLVTQRR
ncbi:hypothetical protein [Catellatospora citrea]|uniref:Uncharacterized protein n=1 Tax=Catellatospora citrea TaxID=53366 RepID=A0A8J3KGB2_9ACTN|nr:hypothetical protein [Catellatospora citrea]RKE07617.1 hypothetical protein C8E86_2450 [Catellatospora citrea]GIF99202.1 hypothetical protein Cci01nite_42960 [Catellatospora citrea]